MTVPRYSESEVIALHDRVRDLSKELQDVLDELLERVMTAIKEGNPKDAAVAIEQIQAIRDVDSGAGGGSSNDSGSVEQDERGSGSSSDTSKS